MRPNVVAWQGGLEASEIGYQGEVLGKGLGASEIGCLEACLGGDWEHPKVAGRNAWERIGSV